MVWYQSPGRCLEWYQMQSAGQKWDAAARLRAFELLTLLLAPRRVDRGIGRGGADQHLGRCGRWTALFVTVVGGAKKVHEVDDEAEVGRADVPGVVGGCRRWADSVLQRVRARGRSQCRSGSAQRQVRCMRARGVGGRVMVLAVPAVLLLRLLLQTCLQSRSTGRSTSPRWTRATCRTR